MAEWTLAEIWNDALEAKPRNVFEPRDRLWASELWKSDIDIFHILKGRTPSNLPNSRSMRKFEAGNLTEWFVKMVLMKSGIYQASQTKVVSSEQGMLPVSGKIDFMAGGVPHVNKTLEEILSNAEFPELYQRLAENIITFFKEKFPDGLDDKILEIKSVATFGFAKVEKTKRPLNGHDIQSFHYSYNLKKDTALVYVCREDLRMMEFKITPDNPYLKKKYLAKISRVTANHKEGIEPPKEPLVLFDIELGKFSKNILVEYSPYLTAIYGFKDPMEYDDAFKKMIGGWNRVLGRVAKGQKMTPKNEEALKQIEAHGFDLNLIKTSVVQLAQQGVELAEEEDE